MKYTSPNSNNDLFFNLFDILYTLISINLIGIWLLFDIHDAIEIIIHVRYTDDTLLSNIICLVAKNMLNIITTYVQQTKSSMDESGWLILLRIQLIKKIKYHPSVNQNTNSFVIIHITLSIIPLTTMKN